MNPYLTMYIKEFIKAFVKLIRLGSDKVET